MGFRLLFIFFLFQVYTYAQLEDAWVYLNDKPNYEYFIERIGDATIKAYGTSIKATASDVSKNGVAYRVYGCGMHAPAQKSASSDIKSIVALESVVVLPK